MGAFLCVVSNCGGGGGSAPIITSVTGNGSSPDVFQDAIIVTGENFVDGMTVELISSSANHLLTYSLDSSTQITTQLPISLIPGDYTLNITRDGKIATHALTILKGEAGILLAEIFGCPSGSSNLDPSGVTTRVGAGVFVYRFSDGSYFVNCSSIIKDSVSGIDSHNTSAFYPSNSTAVVSSGALICVPLYVTATYSISGQTVTYKSQADPSQTETVSCSKAYP